MLAFKSIDESSVMPVSALQGFAGHTSLYS
jgi:hypothetical protein